MKASTIALIVCGFIVAAILILICVCKRGLKGNKLHPGKGRTRTATLPQKTYHDPGQNGESSGIRDGGIDVLAGAAAAVVATTVIASIDDGGGFNDSGLGGMDMGNGNDVGGGTEDGGVGYGGGSGEGGGGDG
ncbi:unnamed protein product [Dovyalis caffra]|uniref:Uncharacterized protein n=1 Tax=Dovyalis caffra TaxID=77055 RepID=A0AAV1SJ35_9ROSI|nr:unnamed protein product [Dovyalis caffra]